MLIAFQVVATFVLVGLALSPSVGQGWREFAVVTLGVGLLVKLGNSEGLHLQDLRELVGPRWALALAGLLTAASLSRSSCGRSNE